MRQVKLSAILNQNWTGAATSMFMSKRGNKSKKTSTSAQRIKEMRARAFNDMSEGIR
jgi:hypothetical protein